MPTPGPLRPIARRALGAQSDDRLVRLVREGHEPAFEEIVRRYRGPLVAFAAAIVSADRAEDVVQSSLLKAHDALGRDEREIALRPWLFAIVRNGALNEVRGQAPVDELREASAIAAGPSEIAEGREDLDRLVVAMCALPDAQRRALVKRELEGVGHGEIAAQLGTTATAVRGLIFRARTGLRDALGALLPLPVVRTLLAEGTAAGVGGGAAAGVFGGTAAKGGAAVTAAVVALGTGVALDRRGDDSGERRDGVARAQAPDGTRSQAGGGDARPASTAPAAEQSETGGGDDGSSGGSGGSDSSGRSGDDSSGSSETGSDDTGGDDDSSGEGESGSGEREKDDGGDSGGGQPAVPPAEEEPEVEEDEDNSGSGSSGSGHGPGGSTPDPPEVEDDSSGSSGSNSGSGSSNSGSGSEEVEVPEVEDDSNNSGSGSSSEDDGD